MGKRFLGGKAAPGLALFGALALSGAGAAAQPRGLPDATAGDAARADVTTARVKAQLASDDALARSNIQVDTDGDVVTLRGTVPSEAARIRALEIARTTSGVQRVEDDLTVDGQR